MDETFDAVYARHGRSIHAFLARLTGDLFTAEDLCQETFVRYLQHEESLKDRNGHVAPWLFRVATNLGLDRLRRLKPSALPEGDLAPAQELHRDDPEVAERVRRGVAALTPDLRAAFLLRAHHGLTFPQLALVLSLSERGAKDRYRRARDELARLLSPWLEDLLP